MQGRTFYRVMLDKLFVDNIFCKTLSSFINFCKEQGGYTPQELKFLKNVPLIKKEVHNTYKNRFIFDSSQLNGAKLK